MKLVHYSVSPGLTEINPNKVGTSGVVGNNFREGKPKIGVSYFYREGTEPEHVVTSRARHKYVTRLQPEQKLYDLGKDEEGIIEKSHQRTGGYWSMDEYHKDLMAAGYHGYYNSESDLPNAIALFHAQPVKQILKDPKGHRNTIFGDEHFEDEIFNPKPKETPITSPEVKTEELVQYIVNKLLG